MYFPAGILHNTASNTWHPFYFRLSPRPSGGYGDPVMRFRSAAHHPDGFASEEEARAYILIQAKWKDTEQVWEWDGLDTPTIIADFAVDQFMSTAPQINGGTISD